ncbi:MAG: hypothetical protein LBT59_04225 [Clostridiales bacterium]|nr:hypothetical protein [Clostridiales bacterium]
MKTKFTAFAFSAIIFLFLIAGHAFAMTQSKGTKNPATLLAGKARTNIRILGF